MMCMAGGACCSSCTEINVGIARVEHGQAQRSRLPPSSPRLKIRCVHKLRSMFQRNSTCKDLVKNACLLHFLFRFYPKIGQYIKLRKRVLRKCQNLPSTAIDGIVDTKEFRKMRFLPQSQSGRTKESRLTRVHCPCCYSIYPGPNPTPAVDWRPG